MKCIRGPKLKHHESTICFEKPSPVVFEKVAKQRCNFPWLVNVLDI